MHKISDIHVIIQNGLQAFPGNILVHLIQTAVVVNFELLVPLLALLLLSGVLAFVIPDPCGHPCGYFRGGDFDNAVAESGTLAGGHRYADKGQENAVCTQNLA